MRNPSVVSSGAGRAWGMVTGVEKMIGWKWPSLQQPPEMFLMFWINILNTDADVITSVS